MPWRGGALKKANLLAAVLVLTNSIIKFRQMTVKILYVDDSIVFIQI